MKLNFCMVKTFILGLGSSFFYQKIIINLLYRKAFGLFAANYCSRKLLAHKRFHVFSCQPHTPFGSLSLSLVPFFYVRNKVVDNSQRELFVQSLKISAEFQAEKLGPFNQDNDKSRCILKSTQQMHGSAIQYDMDLQLENMT